MEDKNKRLMVVVGVLLLIVGVSFAYFVSSVLINGEGAKTKLNTSSINGATIEVRGTLSFNDLDIYPGHQTVSGIELIATGEGEFIPYNLVWKGTNSLNTPLKFEVYRSDNEVEVNATCNKTTKIENGAQILAEECEISNKDILGSSINKGTINKNSEKEILSNAEFITASKEGKKVYYYVILEYPNLEEEQNIDIGGSFRGEVTVEENNTSADITIANIYKEENGEYKQISNIPEEGYILNEERSTCSNNAKPKWNKETNNIEISNLKESGTECNLYFDNYVPSITIADIIAAVNPKDITPTFTNVATTDEGVYKISDGMYGGYSYYWRGAVTNNYVKFANKCWRIIRINGDGSMRLIYDGATCHANGTSTSESLAVTSQAYNPNYNRSEYVGYTYTTGSQRTTSGTASNLKKQNETWYNSNLASYASKIADGKYCNDRNTGSGYSWSSQPSSTFNYTGYKRLYIDYAPTLSCNSGDVYTLKVGAITADEVELAGGRDADINRSYYLYNGQNYWTMSPIGWNGTSSYAFVFYVHLNGLLNNASVDWTGPGVRPVINLKADTTFSGGKGTLDNPYTVTD
jgi:hypothetical protein